MARLISRWKREWKRFSAEPPGRRFRDRHERRGSRRRPWWLRLGSVVAGVVLLLVGAFFAVAPGPAVLFFIPGAVLLARESHAFARMLDAVDTQVAPVADWLHRWWKRLSPLTRRVLGGCAVASAVVGAVAGFLLVH